MVRKAKSATGASKTAARGTAKTPGKKAARKKPSGVSAPPPTVKKRKVAKKAATASPGAAARLSVNLSVAKLSNQEILDDLLGGHWPEDTPLSDVGYGGASNAALAASLHKKGVLVSKGTVLAASTVGQVRKEVDRVS
jgi:hypothetical protein